MGLKFLFTKWPGSIVILVLFSGLWAHSLEMVPGEFVVLLRPGFSESLLLQRFLVQKREVLGLPLRLLRLPEAPKTQQLQWLSTLKELPEVEIIEPNFVYRIGASASTIRSNVGEPDQKKSWGLENTGQPDGWGVPGRAGVDAGVVKAWTVQKGSKAIVVAVIDSGLNYTHPEMQHNLWSNPIEQNGQAGVDDDKNGFIDDIYGYDFVGNDGDPMDDHGHGTHVASIIGAKSDNNLSMAGINFDVSIMPLKFASKEGKGTLDLGLKAIQYATAHGARIINNSWGGEGYSDILSRVVEEANEKNILFVAAAGNSGSDNAEKPIFPASLKNANVLSVAAFDQHGQLWNNSCFGDTTVHLGAPGVEVFGLWGSKFRSMTGTSMAAPHVSGVAALVLSQEPHLSVQELKERLLRTAKPLGNLRGRTITGGAVDAYRALKDESGPLYQDDPFFWTAQKEIKLSSAHPYLKDTRQEWLVHVPGAKEMALFFENFELERKNDHLDLYDSQGKRVFVLTGKSGKGWSPIVRGDTIKVVLVSDSNNETYGFDLTKVAYQP